MWIANIHKVQERSRQAGWRMCQPTSNSNLELSPLLVDISENTFFFSPSVGCQRYCHWQGEATLSKEGHMWLGEEGGGLCKVTHRVPVTVK